MESEFRNTLLENAVTELARLPGVGRKTALRLALHLLRADEGRAVSLGQSLIDMRRGIHYCKVCHNISEDEVCPICADTSRDNGLVCVVENIKDVMSIERTGQFKGLYHVLGGVISPMDGIGAEMLEIDSLATRAEGGKVREVILALGATIDGDTTCYYIYRLLHDRAPQVKISQLARGVSIGNEIEYIDEITLGRSLLNRTEYTV